MTGGAFTDGEGTQPSPGTPAAAILSSFRAAWIGGQRPRIEDFLPDWADLGHSALLRGLVTLEVAYRLRQGEKPTDEEYRLRFPGRDRTIQEAFRHPAAARPLGGASAPPRAAVGPSVPAHPEAASGTGPVDAVAPPHALATDLGATRRFGDYELLEKIGRDEVGVAYRARQVSLDRIVALKLIMTDGSASDANVQQFHHDTRVVAAFDHPGIVPIFDFGQHEGQYFVSTGYIEGETLARKRAGGGLDLREGVEVIRQVADTIAYAHSKGVAHRNLTPKNILLNARGRPRVTGFNSSAPLQAEGSQGLTGRVLGAPGYLAPEQAREGQEVGPAADIHALGAVLYFVLTGQPPFQGANLVETLLKVLHRDPKPPRQFNPLVPPELEAICLKCLQKRPGRRYGTAARLADDLDRWLRNEPVDVPLEGSASHSVRLLGQLWLSHPRVRVAVAGAVGAILLGVATSALLPRLGSKNQSSAVNPVAQPQPDAVGRHTRLLQGVDQFEAESAGILTQGRETTAPLEVMKAGSTVLVSAKRAPDSPETEGPAHNPVASRSAQGPPQTSVTAADFVQPPTRADSRVSPVPEEIPLPGEIDDLAVGGDLYVVLAFRNPAKLLIFDATTAQIAREFPLTGRAFVAAGSKAFVVVYPDSGRFQTWEFATMSMKKEVTLDLPPLARIEGIAMGSHSEGPLLVVWEVQGQANRPNPKHANSPFDRWVWAVLIEPSGLQPIPIGEFAIRDRGPFNGPFPVTEDHRWFVPHPNLSRGRGVTSSFQVLASSQGDLFTISTGNGSALIVNWDSGASRSLLSHYLPGEYETLIPAPDGRRVLTGNNRSIWLDSRGVSGREGYAARQVTSPGVTSLFRPTADPAYFLRFDADAQGDTNISILLPTGEELLKQPVPDPRIQGGNRNLHSLKYSSNLNSKMMLLLAEPQLLVLIPPSGNRLLTRRIALREKEARLNHSVVVSASDVFAAAGQTFRHQIRVLPKASGVRFSLSDVSPPTNLRVSENGEVIWPVPPRLRKEETEETTAVIRVNDATGRAVSHRLNILVY